MRNPEILSAGRGWTKDDFAGRVSSRPAATVTVSIAMRGLKSVPIDQVHLSPAAALTLAGQLVAAAALIIKDQEADR